MYDQKITETNDVAFLLSVIGHQPKKILEVGCGSGRILVPLAKAGHTVSGLDANQFMLNKILAKAEGLCDIEWRKTDVVYSDWGTGFDVVVLASNILYNIESDMDYKQSQQLLIQKAASALVLGGYVYIEYQPGGHHITQYGSSYNKDDEWVMWEGTDGDGNHGRQILLGDSYDAITGTCKFIRRFELTLKNGEIITRDVLCQKHVASLEQLHGWLHNAGFIIEQEYGDTNKNAVTDESRGVIIYAKVNTRSQHNSV